MRLTAVISALLLAACGQPDGVEVPQRQQPSVTEPGIHVSGSIEYGAVRRF